MRYHHRPEGREYPVSPPVPIASSQRPVTGQYGIESKLLSSNDELNCMKIRGSLCCCRCSRAAVTSGHVVASGRETGRILNYQAISTFDLEAVQFTITQTAIAKVFWRQLKRPVPLNAHPFTIPMVILSANTRLLSTAERCLSKPMIVNHHLWSETT